MSDFPLDPWRGRDGSRLQIRAIRPRDEPALAALFAGLDPLSRRRHFHGPVNDLTPQCLHDLARADGDRRVRVATAVHAGCELLVAGARCVTDATLVVAQARCHAEAPAAVAPPPGAARRFPLFHPFTR